VISKLSTFIVMIQPTWSQYTQRHTDIGQWTDIKVVCRKFHKHHGHLGDNIAGQMTQPTVSNR